MAKNNYFKSKTKKSLIALLAAAAMACTGLAAACKTTDEEEKPTAFAPKQEDTQTLKNGNFEFFNYPSEEYIKDGKAVYLIKTPDSWTRSGDSSNAMSGIIGTSAYDWNALTSSDLKGKLEYNADIKTTDDDYVDYNGMKARDLLYKDTYAALLSDSDVEESYIKYQSYKDYFKITESEGKFYFGNKEVAKKPVAEGETESSEYYFVNSDGSLGESVRHALIDNPGTPYTVTDVDDGDSYYTDGNGKKVNLYKDAEGRYYYDTDLKYPYGNVLMVHNYPTNSNYNGISQYYTSQTITLEANTAAEISLWVKTSDLKFDKGYSQTDDQDRGAFIEVVQTVSGTTLDSFKIKAINTEKIIADNPYNADIEKSNGWLKYTVYVNACDFADSTIQLNLGLGQSENSEKCTGYAFFDDVSVTKLRSLDEKVKDGDGNDTSEYRSSYNQYKDAITSAKTSCTLTSDADDKIFIADTDIRYHGDSKTSPEYLRHSQHFRYLIDLASENGTASDENYKSFTFSSANTAGKLTSEKSNGKWYAAGTLDEATEKAVNNATLSGVTAGDTEQYNLPDNMKGGINTAGDLIGTYGVNGVDTANYKYTKKLNDALTGKNGFDKLPGYSSDSNMLVMLSAEGAPYTSTLTDNNMFTLEYGEYMIVSFWVKTSDMNGSTAATVKITDVDNDDSTASFNIDTTGKTTDFGDDENIYNGWVQCFIFVENNCDDKDETSGEYVKKHFKIDFCFGNTDIANATASSYDYGWIAMANLQSLKVNEKIYNLTSAGDSSVKFSFSADDSETENKVFAEANGISDVKTGIATPSSFNGVNGGSSYVSDNAYTSGFDAQNTNGFAGLINKDGFKDYSDDVRSNILNAFGCSETDAVRAWNTVFGEECYQPLIILNNLRRYAENASANENTYKNYYVKAEDGYTGSGITYEGAVYRKVADGEAYDEDTEYFSFAVNYGFIGESKNIAADSYETVSVKVKVSDNAQAYIYLVDSNTREVLSYSTPAHTFYYDDEGNVLNKEFTDDMTDEDHKNAIVYTLRKDGLYSSTESGDTTLYANVNNLIKSYKYYKYETIGKYYKNAENGKGVDEILFDDLVDGETYYYENGKVANHFLCTESGKRVYEYADGVYYYLVDGERKNEVKPFDTERAPYRYTAPDNGLPYMVNVNKENSGTGWVTVNFFIHTGSEAVDYRLEIWNGERGSSGISDGTTPANGAIAFDYSAYSATTDNYANLRKEFESNIISEYKAALENKNLLDRIDTENETVAYFEKLIAELIADESVDFTASDADVEAIRAKYGYSALYYTYTLYDSATYEPFNADIAKDGETGYEYKISDNDELLAFLTYKNDKDNSYNIFADYSATDKNIEKATAGDDDDKDDDSTENPTNVWLYVASIVLVIALLITLISLVLRDVLKKVHRTKSNKSMQKNNYRQRKRYIRKLHLVENGETADDGADGVTEPVEETPAEVTPEETSETEPAEETGAENAAEPAETPADGVQTSDTPADSGDNSDSGDSDEQSSDTPADNGDGNQE